MNNSVFEKEIKGILKEFDIETDFEEDKNLIELGLSSIQLMKIVSRLRKKGIKCSFIDLLSRPYLKDWKVYFKSVKSEKDEKEPIPEEMAEEVDMHNSFPMTGVQNAYWIGRSGGQQIGNVGCHGYMEVDCKYLDTDRLNQAFYDLQMHHSMLRAVVTEEGMQKVADYPYAKDIKIYDFSQGNAKEHLENMRKQYSHRLLNIYEGEVIALQVTLLPNDCARIHFDIDLLIADVTSFQIILRDLVHLYNGGELESSGSKFNFAAYLKKEERINKEKFDEDKKYWENRLKTMAGKPELPVKNTDTVSPRFVRRDAFFEPQKWEKFKKRCAKYQVTPAIVLLTLYGKTVARFSENSKFLINLPLFNRSSEYPGMENAVADFTKLLLMEFDYSEKRNFKDEIYKVKAEFQENMRHNDYSGIDVQREYLKQHREEKIAAPIVFSCNLGVPLLSEEFVNTFGNISYMISQTPQVWLDFQLFDNNDGLLMIWDSVEEVFEGNVLDEMFGVFKRLLESAVNMESWTEELDADISNQLKIRKKFEISDAGKTGNLMHKDFFDNAAKMPDAVALIDSDGGSVTYKELKIEALKVAAALTELGIGAGSKVGVCLKRGREQIASVLGILATGAAYVTIGYGQPFERRKAICNLADIHVVITDDDQAGNLPKQVRALLIEAVEAKAPILEISDISAESLAYIIFTSGSTGVPKGVQITHKAAMNTIKTINEMYCVSERDTVLQVSAMDFDLSVYDIFGLLSAGGKVVLIPQGSEVNPKELYSRCEKYNVTIWNSVPALLDMMLIAAEDTKAINRNLRLALVSGDWIPVDLPKRFTAYAVSGTFVSLGGATEGSIWSNYYEVQQPFSYAYRSIPYGHPLKNQKYRVVNDRGEDCPDYVRGELWIGGEGVAAGYIGNEAETEKHFLSIDGENWYRTGDYGLFWADGTIEFMGRMDHQIKLRGHRIETEEIESNFLKNPKVAQAVVLPVGESRIEHLAAFIVPGEVSKSGERIHVDIAYPLEKTADCSEPMEEDILRVTAGYIVRFFEKLNISFDVGNVFSFDAGSKKAGIAAAYRPLVTAWLDLLVEEKIIVESGNNCYKVTGNVSNLKSDTSLKAYDELTQKIMRDADSIVRGEVNSVEAILGDEKFDIQKFVSEQPGAVQKKEFVIEVAEQFVEKTSVDAEEVHVFVLGARDIAGILRLVDRFSGINVKFTVVDTSKVYLERLKNIRNIATIAYRKIEEEKFIKSSMAERYDIVISFDYLHQLANVEKMLCKLRKMITDGGMLLFSEVTENSAIQLVTTAVLEEGFSRFTDRRKGTLKPLLSECEWTEYLKNTDFADTRVFCPVSNIVKQKVFAAFNVNKKEKLVPEALISYISEYVSEYMVPKFVFIMDDIPITANGKINRKELLTYVADLKENTEKTLPHDVVGKQIASVWKQVLKVPQIYMEDDFYLLGGDSLLAVRLKTALKKELGYDISLETIFKNSRFSDFVNDVKENAKERENREALPQVIYNPADAYEPFPLTDVQNAYWIGRNGGYDLGDVSSHCYFEMDSDSIPVNELEEAWNRLISVHGMMRAVVLADGSGQKILEKVPRYHIISAECEEEKVDNFVKGIRNTMSSQKYDSSIWPLFEVKVTYYNQHKSMRLHLSFDNIVFDGFSIFQLFRQWKQLWEGKDISVCKKLTYRDYVLAQEKIRTTKQYDRDIKYWREKVKTIYPAPSLPIKENCKDGKFTRYEFALEDKDWKKIEKICVKNHITLPVVLMSAYSEVLARYSSDRRFTLNLTRFQKLPLDSEVEELIGDFTTLTLLEIDFKNKDSFLERCKAVANQLHRDMEHSLVSGVEVERELAKITGKSDVTMPVVFTSGIGIQGEGQEKAYFGEIIYGESQTPQVWLDNQVSIQNGKLLISWDAVKDMFPDGLVDDMFEEYKLLLSSLIDESVFTKKTSNLLKGGAVYKIEAENNVISKDIRKENFVDAFQRNVEKYPLKTALWTTKNVLTYKELDDYTDRIAAGLISKGVKVNDTVAVIMEKGINQIASALAILKAGACYVPVDLHNPQKRISDILEKSNTIYAVTEKSSANHVKNLYGVVSIFTSEELSEVSAEGVMFPEISPDASAYIIFTSGSTGTPKGVEISHASAMNTIRDINRRFGISEKDGTIMLSNLNFDLSVYDIFGMFSCGGHVVVPDFDKAKDPMHWMDILSRGKVTVWNTVPAFMQMMVEYDMTGNKKTDTSLQIVLLSGDWLPVDLPEKITKLFGNITKVSLGGATEASIWSNYFVIPEDIPKDWKSIPYGKPLANQGFIILNSEMERVPVWVPGELYIIGHGVAKGYVNEEEKTNASFISISGIEGKVYKTGDYGRYLPDGNIQFIGRMDNQIKKGGHRIELGEIESNLNKIAGVKQGIVTFKKEEAGALTAHIICEKESAALIERKGIVIEETLLPKNNRTVAPETADAVKKIENIAVDSIFKDFKDWGILDYLKEKHTTEDITEHFGIKPEFEGLIRNELNVLAGVNVVVESEGRFMTTDPDKALSEDDRLSKRLERAKDTRWEILEGSKDIKNLMVNRREDFIYPEELKQFAVSDEIHSGMLEFINYFAQKSLDSVLEIASRTENHTDEYVKHLSNTQKYLYCDESLSMLECRQEKNVSKQIMYHVYNPEDKAVVGEIPLHSQSLIIAENTLHRFKNLDHVLSNLKELLLPGGSVLIMENTVNSPLMLETVAYFEEGYSSMTDARAKSCLPLLCGKEWKEYALRNGYKNVYIYLNDEEESKTGSNIILLEAPDTVYEINTKYLKNELSKYVPSYMLPEHYIAYEEFPLNGNGKIDREKMKQNAVNNNYMDLKIMKPETDMEKCIAKIWSELLKCEDISVTNGFFELGGDSLKAIKFINQLKEKTGHQISLQLIASHPVLKELAANIKEDVKEADDEEWDEIEEIL